MCSIFLYIIVPNKTWCPTFGKCNLTFTCQIISPYAQLQEQRIYLIKTVQYQVLFCNDAVKFIKYNHTA